MRKSIAIQVTASDYEMVAEKRLPGFILDYVNGAAGQESTMVANESDLRKIYLKQRVLRDVGAVSTESEFFGRKVGVPIILAPIGFAGLTARRGEVQAARAAFKCEVPFTLSTLSICSMEEVGNASPNPFWFQLYMLRDREIIEGLLDRAVRAGCQNLVLTVDCPVVGARHREIRNGSIGGGYAGKLSKLWKLLARPSWIADVGLGGSPHTLGNLSDVIGGLQNLDAVKKFVDSQFDPSLTWQDVSWLRSKWKGGLIIKGIMCGEDAKAAMDSGADGIVVSNHGGRQLEGAPSTISKLPEVVSSCSGKIEVFMDGGIRSGVDVVKALSVGAKGVMIGRPWVWALAAYGEKGVSQLLEQLQKEIAVTMALMGVTQVSEINQQCLENC